MSDQSLFVDDFPHCRARLQGLVASDGRRGGLLLASFPVSVLVLPIALWILTRVISERDKGRFRKPSPSAKTIIVTAVVVATVFAQK